jgi:hypothetical protein
MRRRNANAFMATAAALVAAAAGVASAAVPTPGDVIGIEVGRDRVLADYGQTRAYLAALAAASPRVRVMDIGPTVEGRQMIAAVLSSPGNLARLDELRRSWAHLADPRGLSESERTALAASLPSCALVIAGIHSNEVAGTQSALLLAQRLAAAPDGSPEAGWLERTVVLLVPSMNPDGQDAVVAWYRRLAGTPHEGAGPPFLYHRYAGHDNNRDFVFLTQPESRNLNRLAYREWHPQLFLDLHQMGPTGPRQFVPPFAEPLAPNVHPLVWRMTGAIGSWMALRLEQEGKAGVVSGWMFDGNWIGGTRNTGWWKNVFGLLTETAGAALARPVYVDENELRASGKGLQAYRSQINFPNPWRGGKWGLEEAVAYQVTLTRAFVEFAADHRAEALAGVAAMAAEAVARGAGERPAAYVVRMDGPDPGRARRLVNLLLEAGAEAELAGAGCTADGAPVPAGSVVFSAAQPLRQYLVEVLERQSYPEVSLGGDEIALPYDITAWTMPLYLGVDVLRAERGVAGPLSRIAALLTAGEPAAAVRSAGAIAVPAEHLAAHAVANAALAQGVPVRRLAAAGPGGLAAGSIVLAGGEATFSLLQAAGAEAVALPAVPAAALPLRRVRVGVYHPHMGLEDAGWCRWALERAGFPVAVVDSGAIASGVFAGRVDVLVVPPLSGKAIVEGPERRVIEPPQVFRGGIGKEGAEAVKRWIAGGGTAVAFAASAEWLAELTEAPVGNALKGAGRDEFSAPGALLDLRVEQASPLGWGLPPRVAALIDAPVAFETRLAADPAARTVAARFPDGPLLLSGWMRGEERLRRRAAAVEVRSGAGRAVLFSFAPYFRGQTEGTFALLYNAVMLEMMEAGT